MSLSREACFTEHVAEHVFYMEKFLEMFVYTQLWAKKKVWRELRI